jgi:hypothetical protein
MMETIEVDYRKEKFNGEKSHISGEKLVELVSSIFGSDVYPNPDEPLKPGPWGPVIREALTSFLFHGREEIWDALIPHSLAELNPQPLPPRAKLLVSITQKVIDRMLLIQETADVMNQTGEQEGIIIVGGRISQFVSEIDELCPRLPRKFPKPKGGEERFTTLELLVAGSVFEQNAAVIEDTRMQQALRSAGALLVETGLGRM